MAKKKAQVYKLTAADVARELVRALHVYSYQIEGLNDIQTLGQVVHHLICGLGEGNAPGSSITSITSVEEFRFDLADALNEYATQCWQEPGHPEACEEENYWVEPSAEAKAEREQVIEAKLNKLFD